MTANGGDHEEHRAEWGRRVDDARRARRMDRGALARAAGVTEETIGSIEDGQLRPTDDLRARLATVLDIDVDELFPPRR